MWVNREIGNYMLRARSPALAAGTEERVVLEKGVFRKMSSSDAKRVSRISKLNIGAF
jgi:hypothetical protein